MRGKTVSHYRILEELGRGGMGVVYKAEDTKLRRTVALKFLPPEYTQDPEAKKRFVQEAQSVSSLDHANICTIHEIDETDDGRLFIAMTFYEGETLKQKLECGPLDIDVVIDIAVMIAKGLEKAHKKGIIHRDIKPGNLIITEDGVVKIVDFGIAKLARKTKITKTGTSLGTVAYMSPEQSRGGKVDHRTDIWSLGVVLFEMITGELPFRGDYDQAVVYSILNEEPASVLDLCEDIPAELAKVVEKALTKQPDERYQKIEELKTDLNTVRKMKKAMDASIAPVETTQPSIAVLPFVNMSNDPEQEYFCDGMAEEIINALTKIENLHIPARTSSFAFKDQKADIREIGRKLDVEHVLEGSVRKAGNRLRITSQLIKVDDGYHLWSERFDRELDDVFAIQDEITAAIVDNLKVRLLNGEKKKLVKRYTENLEAYSFYLKGIYFWYGLTPEAWAKSYECFQQAIALDPNYAMAYMGLSTWYGSQMFWGDTHPREAVSKSTELILKVLDLDDTIADAHSALGIMIGFMEWKRREAKKEFKKSIELGPRSAFVHINYALFMTHEKAFDEALVHAERVRQLDPLNSTMKGWAASIKTYSGLYEESVIELKQVIAADPQFWQPYYNLSVAYIYQEKFKDAISAAEEAVRLSGGASIAKTFLGCAYALDGQTKKAQEQLDDLLDRVSEKYVQFTLFILLYNALGETDEAYRWMEKAVQDHDPWLCFYNVFPRSLQADEPRFTELYKATGLEL